MFSKWTEIEIFYHEKWIFCPLISWPFFRKKTVWRQQKIIFYNKANRVEATWDSFEWMKTNLGNFEFNLAVCSRFCDFLGFKLTKRWQLMSLLGCWKLFFSLWSSVNPQKTQVALNYSLLIKKRSNQNF